MIFCRTQEELDKELDKLMQREDVAKSSIRVFALQGGFKKGGKK